ncbi:endoplasmic reticulum membrane-associated RNA degradation protein-like [Diadema antillarum]|uniref:endoplasmic reticulum membrane-associated RNA degradation protein-like n=1 Tax=Diadema antillarum TaxID=105358 RepID=UPI003A888303
MASDKETDTTATASSKDMAYETFLSPNVHHLVCDVGTTVHTSVDMLQCLNASGLLDWDAITAVAFEGKLATWDTQTDFVDVVKKFAPVCQDIHSRVMVNSLSELEARYGPWFKWTGCPEVFISAFELLVADTTRGTEMSLLLTTAALERALGDVYLMKNSPCPSLLKDLLVTQELRQIFGIPALFCLRTLMGPPTSLNLRNILWHGFAAPGEIPTRYASFLLLLTASLGHILSEVGIHVPDIPHRRPIEFNKQVQRVGKVLPDILGSETKELTVVMRNATTLVCQGQASMWELAVEYYKTRRYGWCVSILCPLLEHVVRMAFGSANSCPDRVMTAESSVLFTTFDEMLCAELPDGTPNLLIPAYSEPYMDMLMDLLLHPDGPRLRDHASHGEVDLDCVPQDLATYTICVFIASCTRTAAIIQPGSADGEHPLLRKIQDWAASYVSLFHPLASCRHLVSSLLTGLAQWGSLPRPSPGDELDYVSWETGGSGGGYHHGEESGSGMKDQELISLVLRMSPGLNGDDIAPILKCITRPFSSTEPLMHRLQGMAIHTLFRPRRELETAGILHQIMSRCLVVDDQVCSLAALRFSQWRDKQLRSRQRANYIRFLNRPPKTKEWKLEVYDMNPT